MFKIINIINARIPTEKAHGLQIMKMSEAFAAEGNSVTLFVPTRRNLITTDPYEFYKVSKTFSIVRIKCPDMVRFGAVGFIISNWIFAVRATIRVAREGFDVVYSRDGRTLWMLSWVSKKFVFEVHDDQRKWWARRVLRTGRGLIARNRPLAHIHEDFVKKKLNILVSPSAVSLEEFETSESRESIRKRLGFSPNKKTVLYAGHLYSYKGVDTLADAAIQLPEYEFIFVGGTDVDLVRFRESYGRENNIKIIGQKLHHDVALYMRAADVLILPNSAKDVFSFLYTSPIKLFEYMASYTSIIASDIPSIREILDESMAFFFNPDDVKSLISVIKKTFAEPLDAKQKAGQAAKEVRKYSYINQAKQILHFIHHD